MLGDALERHGQDVVRRCSRENNFCLTLTDMISNYSWHYCSQSMEHTVINKHSVFKKLFTCFALVSSPPLQAHVSCSTLFKNVFLAWKVDIMNTQQQRSDSFFTLLATKPPVTKAVDVNPIIDLARHSRSSQLAEVLMFLSSLHAAEMPHLLPAGLRDHLLHWNQHIIAYLHLSW